MGLFRKVPEQHRRSSERSLTVFDGAELITTVTRRRAQSLLLYVLSPPFFLYLSSSVYQLSLSSYLEPVAFLDVVSIHSREHGEG